MRPTIYLDRGSLSCLADVSRRADDRPDAGGGAPRPGWEAAPRFGDPEPRGCVAPGPSLPWPCC